MGAGDGRPDRRLRQRAPAIPGAVAETGISERNLLYLMLKFMHVEAAESVLDLANRMKLPRRVIQQLIEDSIHQRFIGATGASSDLALSTRYALTEAGRNAAKEALEQSVYLGPRAGVARRLPGADREAAHHQRDAGGMTLREGFAGLVVPEMMFRRLLPAINAGRSVLLVRAARQRQDDAVDPHRRPLQGFVYIPYAVEVSGPDHQGFRRPDPSSRGAPEETDHGPPAGLGLHRETFDQRWQACSRPVVMAGGEMTIDMLDLQFNPEAKFYDAPLHVKALNGMLLIDDFGRQRFPPNDLLNRFDRADGEPDRFYEAEHRRELHACRSTCC